jgi:hypothetical protein
MASNFLAMTDGGHKRYIFCQEASISLGYV